MCISVLSVYHALYIICFLTLRALLSVYALVLVNMIVLCIFQPLEIKFLLLSLKIAVRWPFKKVYHPPIGNHTMSIKKT